MIDYLVRPISGVYNIKKDQSTID